MPVELTKENFEATLAEGKPVLVDFWASWCGPCKIMNPVMDKFANEHPEITVGKVNIDDNEDLAQKFNVMSIPTFMLFKDGSEEPVETIVGALPMHSIENRILPHVETN